MITLKVVYGKLEDDSKVHDVLICDGNDRIRLSAVTEKHAERMILELREIISSYSTNNVTVACSSIAALH
jgi:hypothetical protein